MDFSLDYFLNKKSCWEFLQETKKPIFIYGMGDGCLKILKRFEAFGIKPEGIFASDEFVRGHSFEGYLVKKLSDVEAEFDDFVIVLAFAAGYTELVEKIKSIATKHTLLAPDVPVVDDGTLFDKDFLRDNFDKFEAVFNKLSDEISKSVFKNVIEYKITGEITKLSECQTDVLEAYENIIKPQNEIYVDLGAYTGDTVKEMLLYSNGSYDKIYAIEPNNRNFRKLTEATEGMENVYLFKSASWNEDTTLFFSKGGGRMAKISDKGIETDARSVDSVLDGQKATYIKYDVEGAEKQAIEGTENTIRNFKPKLNIAVYHRNEDMFAIPLQILDINPDYKLYMRHFEYIPAWDTNLYCV